MTTIRGRLAAALPVIVIVLASLGGWAVRWSQSSTHASGDTFWYSRAALEDAGWSSEAASIAAARLALGDPDAAADSPAVTSWLQTAATIDPRYPAIFTERPLYPLLAVPFVLVLGPGGMVGPVLLGALLTGLAIGLLVLARTRRRIVGVVACAVLFVSPAGAALTLDYADALMLGLWAVALAAASAYLVRPRRRWLVTLAAAAVLMGWTKIGNEVALAGALLLVTAFRLVLRRPWRPSASLGAIATAAVVVQLGVFQLSGAAGMATSVQDLLTRHFTVPDVSDPWIRLARIDLGLLRTIPSRLLGMSPIDIGLVVIGAIGFARARGTWRLPWVAGAVATLSVVALHPVSSEFPRLLAPIWLSVAIGTGSLLNEGLGRVLAGRGAAPELLPEPA